MTTKEKKFLKLSAIEEQEPIQEQNLDILETKSLGKRETTPYGRIIRTREDLTQIDRCPYPKEDEL